jgi:3-oxoadipate enol-lactonase
VKCSSSAGSPLFRIVEGEGPPLVLLNGVAMTAASWAPMATRLTDRCTVVRCDLRGQLLSPGPPPKTLDEHAEDVVDLLDELGIEGAHLLGTSFGGAVAALTAARWPGRTRSLITVASSARTDQAMAAEIRRWRAACLEIVGGADRALLGRMIERVSYSPSYRADHGAELEERRQALAALPDRWFENLVRLLDSVLTRPLVEDLAAIRCPTLVAAAGLDRVVPGSSTRALAASIEGADYRVIEGAGHAVVIERPQEIAELARHMLDRV